jgi:uncharacterized protein
MAEPAYIDTSSLLKLLIAEPESALVAATIESERSIVISSLTELEARSQLLALRRGGVIRFVDYRAAIKILEELEATDPFHAVLLGGSVFDLAIAHLKTRGAVHCRSLDRLHLAAMQSLELSRLVTNDRVQAKAARSLGLTVIRPA